MAFFISETDGKLSAKLDGSTSVANAVRIEGCRDHTASIWCSPKAPASEKIYGRGFGKPAAPVGNIGPTIAKAPGEYGVTMEEIKTAFVVCDGAFDPYSSAIVVDTENPRAPIIFYGRKNTTAFPTV